MCCYYRVLLQCANWLFRPKIDACIEPKSEICTKHGGFSKLQIASILWIQGTLEHRSNDPPFPKKDVLIQTLKECRSYVHNASFDTLAMEKILGDYLVFTQKPVLKVTWEIDFWAILLHNWLKSEFVKKFKHCMRRE